MRISDWSSDVCSSDLSVESTTDYIQSVQRSLAGNPGLMNLAGAAALGGPSSPFAPIVAALMPNGPGGPFCQSAASPNDGGVYSGARVGCFNQSLDFDLSNAPYRQWSAEAHIDSTLHGLLHFKTEN